MSQKIQNDFEDGPKLVGICNLKVVKFDDLINSKQVQEGNIVLLCLGSYRREVTNFVSDRLHREEREGYVHGTLQPEHCFDVLQRLQSGKYNLSERFNLKLIG